MLKRLYTTSSTFVRDLEAALHARISEGQSVAAPVHDIIAEVRERGDGAVLEYTKKFDRVSYTAKSMRVSPADIDTAVKACEKPVLEALKLASSRIRAFHQKQLPKDMDYTDDMGVRLGMKWSPIEAVGMYVPGGLASYPSSVLMNGVPAKVAGVKRLVMAVPTPDGHINPAVLAAARLADVDEIYKIGGAQAIAALAYGTATIRPVDKIVGPGNAYVAEAKRQVFGKVGIDMIAGPSEILVVADRKSNPNWIAADLLSQAEHDREAQCILMTDNAEFADTIDHALSDMLKTLPRRKIAEHAIQTFGLCIVVEDIEEAAPIIDRIAPEHLELSVERPEQLAKEISNAGAMFLGRYTPEAIGDYMAGPSHVLPTMGTARFSSGLSVYDFIKKTSLISCTPEAFAKLAAATEALAMNEGLEAHARSVSVRRN